MITFVWDTSALLNLKEPNAQGYSPAASLYKDFNDGWLPGPYRNLYPAVAVFELNAGVSRKHREGQKILREFYLLGPESRIYPIDEQFIRRSAEVVTEPGFSQLRGADLIFACCAYIESAYLVTLDNHFNVVQDRVKVINLNESRESPAYRSLFESHQLNDRPQP